MATRVSNRTDDILGAQPGTMPTRGPRFWCAFGRTMHLCFALGPCRKMP